MTFRKKKLIPYMVAFYFALLPCVALAAEADEATAADKEIAPFSSGAAPPLPSKTFEELPVNTETSVIYADVLSKLDPMMAGHTSFIDALLKISNELEVLKYFERAEKLLFRAQKLTESEYCDVGTRIEVQSALADLYERQENFRGALEHAEKAVEISKGLWDPTRNIDPWLHTYRLLTLARIQVELKKFDSAESNILEAQRFYTANRNLVPRISDYSEGAISVNRNLVHCLAARGGRIEETSKIWEKLISDYSKLHYPGYGQGIHDMQEYTQFLRENNQTSKADKFEKNYMVQRNAAMKHSDSESYQIKMERNEQRRNSKYPPLRQPLTKKQEANAGSLI